VKQPPCGGKHRPAKMGGGHNCGWEKKPLENPGRSPTKKPRTGKAGGWKFFWGPLKSQGGGGGGKKYLG